jgi:uncharacterized integral membrane protein
MSLDPNQLPSQQEERRPARRRERARLTAAAVLGALVVAFAVVNLSNVKVDWIVGSAHSPLILVIAVSVLIGAGIDRLAVRRARTRSKSPDASGAQGRTRRPSVPPHSFRLRQSRHRSDCFQDPDAVAPTTAFRSGR